MTTSINATGRLVAIDLIGLLWCDRKGTTYHTVRVVVTTERGGVWSQSRYDSGITYGYGNAYEETAAEILSRIVPGWFQKGASVRLACESRKVLYTSERATVKRKRDL